MVEHSVYDDEMANSRRALSLVLPNYGMTKIDWPSGAGVHEFQNDYWHLLPESDAAKRVVVVDSYGDVELIDTRPK